MADSQADPGERAARSLCLDIGVEPWDTVRAGGDRRFAGYDGDYYMNWARDRVTEWRAISRFFASLGVE